MAVIGYAYNNGIQSSTIANNTARIAVLEQLVKLQADGYNDMRVKLEVMNERGERSKVNIDFLVDCAKRKGGCH